MSIRTNFRVSLTQMLFRKSKQHIANRQQKFPIKFFIPSKTLGFITFLSIHPQRTDFFCCCTP